MDCEYHYRLTRRAEKELDDILDYIGNELDNAKAAAKLMETNIWKATDGLPSPAFPACASSLSSCKNIGWICES